MLFAIQNAKLMRDFMMENGEINFTYGAYVKSPGTVKAGYSAHRLFGSILIIGSFFSQYFVQPLLTGVG